MGFLASLGPCEEREEVMKPAQFTVGVIVGAVLMFGIALLPSSLISKAHEVLDKCEAALPRSQHCELTAVAKP